MDLLKEATEQSQPKRYKQITFPLALFQQDFFPRSGVCMFISYQAAYIIAAADKDQDIFYVEFPNNNHNKDKSPKLWIKKDYLLSLTHWKELKMESELYRQRSYIMQKNRENLIYKVSKLTGLSKDDEATQAVAEKILLNDTDSAYQAVNCARISFDIEEFKTQWKKEHP